MRRLARALGALSLTLCAGGAVALAPDRAEAQGKGRKSWQQNDKQYRKELKRELKQERKDARRLGTSQRLYDRRLDGRRDDRYDRDDDRYDVRRTYPTRRRPVATYNAGASRVPPGHLPPPGLCRIWIDGVPPGRQPRPTTCAAAERNRPYNARVIYGTQRYGEIDPRRDDVYDPSRTRYPDSRYPDSRYPDSRYPDSRTQPRRPIPLPFP